MNILKLSKEERTFIYSNKGTINCDENKTIIIMTDEEILTKKNHHRLVGWSIDLLLIPIKFRDIFKELPYYKNIVVGLAKDGSISYY